MSFLKNIFKKKNDSKIMTDATLSNSLYSEEKIISVKIGHQEWMAENLNVDKFRNGDLIPHAKSYEEWTKAIKREEPAWCYYENDPENGKIYGKLYNWVAVNYHKGLAPMGWHVASDEEWTTLINYCGGEFIAGDKLKGNKNAFAALPGSFRYLEGFFGDSRNHGYWWTATEAYSVAAYCRFICFSYSNVSRDSKLKYFGFSVRCVRDDESLATKNLKTDRQF